MGHLTLYGASWQGTLCRASQLVQQATSIRNWKEDRPFVLLLLSGQGQWPIGERIGGLPSCWNTNHLWPTPIIVLYDRLELPWGYRGVSQGDDLAGAASNWGLELQAAGLGLRWGAGSSEGEEAVLTALHLASNLPYAQLAQSSPWQ